MNELTYDYQLGLYWLAGFAFAPTHHINSKAVQGHRSDSTNYMLRNPDSILFLVPMLLLTTCCIKQLVLPDNPSPYTSLPLLRCRGHERGRWMKPLAIFSWADRIQTSAVCHFSDHAGPLQPSRAGRSPAEQQEQPRAIQQW